jgi:hypothetical protein
VDVVGVVFVEEDVLPDADISLLQEDIKNKTVENKKKMPAD